MMSWYTKIKRDMKTLAKLFVAVAVLFVGFSCTTDATEDLGVAVGGQTEIALSLESSRTQLGEKADGVYPLYWSEGDKIAVNGVASNEVPAEAVGLSSATFVVNGVVAHPYNIVYPAPAEGVTAVVDGCYPVVFPATQTYVAGNIDGKAAAMCGYAAEGATPTLTHLTGVLRFAIKGEATLASLRITSQSGVLSGTYDVNCATGELTAQEGSTSNVVSMSFGEGLVLGDAATPIYVAIPAGEYGVIECMFTTNDGKKMAASFDSTAKPITAGKVREFAELTFAAESVDNDILEIYDVADMQTFAAQLALSSWKQVKVMKSIDMTGVEWTPVEGFTGVFDGQDNEIKGLTKPLFGTTSGTIKNVHLKEVALNLTDTTFAGSLVVSLQSTAEQTAVVANCSAEGTIVYSNNAVTPTADFQSRLINVGGLIGRAYAAKISKCVNRVNIDVQLSTPADIGTTKLKVSPSFGGVVAHIDTADESITAVPCVEECVNYGSVTNNDSKSNVTYSSPIMAGVVGCIMAKDAIVTKCENYGVMKNTKAIRQGDVAGIVGRTYAAEVSHCVNHEGADIVFTNEGRYSFIGGIAGDAYAGAFSYCTNKGEIQYVPSVSSTSGYQWMGGGVAYTRTSSAITIKNCVNEGKITHSGNVRNGASNCYIVVGGVAGNVTALASIEDCENKAEILITGVKGNTSTETAAFTCVGGVVGSQTPTGSKMLRCTNSGVVNYNATIYGKGTVSDHYVGGLVGSLKGSAEDCVNNAEVNIDTRVEAVADAVPAITVCAGGCVGNFNTGTLKNCTNKGAVTFKKDAKTYGYSLGGIVGQATSTIDGCTNEGEISAYGDTVECDGTLVSIKIGGLGGYATTVKNSTNAASGKVTVKGKVYPSGAWPGESVGTSIGGMFGHKNSTTTNCHNYAPLDVTVNTAQPTLYTMNGGFYIGGLAGYAGSNWSDCSNNGDITVDGTYDLYLDRYAHLGISGCISRLANATYTNVDNHGNITVNVTIPVKKNTHSTDINHLYVGGVITGFGGSKGLTGCDNSGKITIGEGTVVDNVYIVAGGVCANAMSGNFLVNCHNSGDVECHGTGKFGIVIGGVFGRHTSDTATVSDCSNSGTVLVTKGEKGESYGKGVYMGGLSGSQSTKVVAVTNFRNSGKMIFKGKSTDVTRIAGIVGSHTQSAESWTGIVNVGDIDFLPADKDDYIDSKTYIGGLVGNSAKGIADAVCYCSINAVGASNVGIALGTPRSAASLAANCQLGGAIVGEYNIEDEEYKIVALDGSNYFNYIYGGGTTDWGDSTDYDGCTVLTSKPTFE